MKESAAGLVELFPARMGVFPPIPNYILCDRSVPRAHGGISSEGFVTINGNRCSPRAWGYFRSVSRVFRSSIAVPRAHGGISASAGGRVKVNRCSPRAWGYFLVRALLLGSRELFPARMGVFHSNSQLWNN